MAGIPEHVFLLAAFHLAFFWKFYTKPEINCTSEIASTYFPFFRWAGKRLRAGKTIARDNIYYYYPGSIPFLSTFYPVWRIMAWLSSFISDLRAFRLYVRGVYVHHFICSLMTYYALLQWFNEPISVFGAITWTYSAYNIKPQSPMIAFTHAWLPGTLIGGPLGIISCGMAILSGYWPLSIFFIPIAAFIHPEILFGFILALPQICLFIPYWKNSIRYKQKVDKQFGRVPPWQLIDLIIPNLKRGSINGVLFPEMAMFSGILTVILMPFTTNAILIAFLATTCLSLGLIRPLFRIPARFIHLMTCSLVFGACVSMMNLHISDRAVYALILIQSFDLMRNAIIFPMWPFTEWWKKPKELYETKLAEFLKRNLGHYRVSGLPFPLHAGYFHGFRTLGYTGGFQLRRMAEHRGDENPNGSGAHDWFVLRGDGEELDSYGVKYAYKPKGKLIKGKWKQTRIPNLYENLAVRVPKSVLSIS